MAQLGRDRRYSQNIDPRIRLEFVFSALQLPIMHCATLWSVMLHDLRKATEATMTFRQRIRLAGAIVALLIFPFADNTSAQDWPARNVTVVVPLAAGSA